MSEVERDRLALHQKARDCFGEREGDILMEHLPPAGWSHLATKDDVALSGALLRTELAEVGNEIADLRTELKTEIADLRTETATLRGDLVSYIDKGFKSQTWKMVSAIGASQTFTVAMVGLMLHYVR